MSSEFSFLKLWAHNNLAPKRHHFNTGAAVIEHGKQTQHVFGLKCERPDSGHVYFLFPPSVTVEKGDKVAWAAGPGNKDEWLVEEINQTRESVRCEVRRPRTTDQSIDDLLRSSSLKEAADYLSNARERLSEGTPTGWGDCVANCRNALQATVRQLTGEGHFSAGIKKLRDVCGFGDRELEFVERVEKMFASARDVLSKTGAHPPTPDYPFAAFALELTTTVLRYVVTTRK